MSIIFVEYKSREELQHAHPDVKNFKLLYQIPRGQTHEVVLTALRKMNTQGRVYQVGDFIWTPAETMPRLTP